MPQQTPKALIPIPRPTPRPRPTQPRRLGKKPSLPRTAELKYIRDIRAIFRAIHATYEAELLVRRDSGSSIQISALLARRVGSVFDRMAQAVSRHTRGQLEVTPIRPTELGVNRAISEARDESIQLVEKAHRVYAAEVRALFDTPAPGTRVEDLARALRERADVSESRAELIARDQTLKLNGAITQARQEGAGIEEYEWSTSNDERVRESHVANQGQRFRWDDPPETGHPGQDYQCRCVAIPVIPALE